MRPHFPASPRVRAASCGGLRSWNGEGGSGSLSGVSGDYGCCEWTWIPPGAKRPCGSFCRVCPGRRRRAAGNPDDRQRARLRQRDAGGGILAASLSLFGQDFRSGERTFQLLCQAAGRAGRGDKPGEVVIQTYSPDHYAITASVHHSYEEFYGQNNLRNLMAYPPCAHLLVILVQCGDESSARRFENNKKARKARRSRCSF